VHAGRKRHFDNKIKPKIAWPNRVVQLGCPAGLAGSGMLWGILIILMAGGVFGASFMMDSLEVTAVYKEMMIGAGIGIGVASIIFVYVALIVYAMASSTGRKVLMGSGIFSLLLGAATFVYFDTLSMSMASIPILSFVFATSKWLGIPFAINGGFLCKLGSFSD